MNQQRNGEILMKKILSFLLIFALFCGGIPALASDAEKGPTEETAAQTEGAEPGLDIAAKSGILIDNTTGKVLYEKNPHEKMPPASITKIMTMILVMEAIENETLTMDDMVTASAHAASMGGTQIWLEENEQMTVRDLMKATAVASANDAAMALAEHVGGSEEGFVAMMNNKAAELGMQDTTFKNPTGLDADGHLSSSHDIALMSRELLRHSGITEFTSIWMDSLRDGKTELVNTNKLVRFYKGCTGLKTGTTDGAGSCVSVSAERDGLSLISVVMGCTTSQERFQSARKLLDHGFASYVMFDTAASPENLAPVRVIGGVEKEVPVQTDAGGKIIIRKGKEKSVTQQIDILPEVEAPVAEGQALGSIKLSVDGEEIASFTVTAQKSVEKMTVWKAFVDLFGRLMTFR